MTQTLDLPSRRLPLHSSRVPVLRRRRRAGWTTKSTRVAFQTPFPWRTGFAAIERYLTEQNVPLLGFCACELRSPAPVHGRPDLSHSTGIYCDTLATVAAFMTGDDNPVARSNVCPVIDEPAERIILRPFPSRGRRQGASGSLCDRRQRGKPTTAMLPYRDRHSRSLRRHGSRKRWREKGVFRSGTHGTAYGDFGSILAPDNSVPGLYCLSTSTRFFRMRLSRRGAAARHGLTWHLARPPVQGLEYEMDCRSVPVERCMCL